MYFPNDDGADSSIPQRLLSLQPNVRRATTGWWSLLLLPYSAPSQAAAQGRAPPPAWFWCSGGATSQQQGRAPPGAGDVCNGRGLLLLAGTPLWGAARGLCRWRTSVVVTVDRCYLPEVTTDCPTPSLKMPDPGKQHKLLQQDE
jgi:hypothetical protein